VSSASVSSARSRLSTSVALGPVEIRYRWPRARVAVGARSWPELSSRSSGDSEGSTGARVATGRPRSVTSNDSPACTRRSQRLACCLNSRIPICSMCYIVAPVCRRQAGAMAVSPGAGRVALAPTAMSPVELEREVRQLDNDVQSIYELLNSITRPSNATPTVSASWRSRSTVRGAHRRARRQGRRGTRTAPGLTPRAESRACGLPPVERILRTRVSPPTGANTDQCSRLRVGVADVSSATSSPSTGRCARPRRSGPWRSSAAGRGRSRRCPARP